MTRDPIRVAEDTTLKEATLLLRSHHVRHLPVANGKLLVGMVSDRDLRRATPSLLSGVAEADYEQVMENTPVTRIMTREPYTVTEDTPVDEAVRVLIERKFGSLPVVDGRELIGIFTDIDALKILLAKLDGSP